MDNNYLNEFVNNPSEISKELVRIVSKITKKYDSGFKSGIIRKFLVHLKINLYLKGGYKEYYNFLNNYDVQKLKNLSLSELFLEFENFYDPLIFNNVALAFLFSTQGKINSSVLTKEDEKILLLQKTNKNNINKFKSLFGHYSLNSYELSYPRFKEYRDSEILKLVKLAKKITISKKITLEDYIKSNKNEVMPILVALRELGKYNVLFIIDALRNKLLGISKLRKTNNIFNLSIRDKLFK